MVGAGGGNLKGGKMAAGWPCGAYFGVFYKGLIIRCELCRNMALITHPPIKDWPYAFIVFI